MADNIIRNGPDFDQRLAGILSTGLSQLIGNKLYDLTGTQPGQYVSQQPLGGTALGGDTSGLPFKDQLSLAQFQQRQQQLGQNQFEKQKESRLKETKEQRKSYEDQAKAAKENLINIGRMEQLINSGKLSGPVQNKLMNAIGLAGWRNPETQEFEKLSTDFLRNAKAIFGARVTQGEVMRYLQTVPTLMQSDEGKRAVMRNMRRYNEAAILRNDAKNDIIRQNGGIPPYNLEEQIEKLVGPQLDELTQGLFGNDLQNTTFNELPNAKNLKGRKIVDEDTGDVYISDGIRWVKGR